MLTQIHITNLITIEEVHVDFAHGTTVITGETGAGKSILIDAIELALGERASPHLIRAGQEKMDICLCFDLRNLHIIPESLKSSDFDPQTQECIVRRTVTRDGRSRTFLNDMPVTLPMLRDFSESLVDIHGQHEHQSLLKTEKQRELLDRFGNHLPLAHQIRWLSEQYRTITHAIENHQVSTRQREERRDFLRYQLNDLESLQLQAKEWFALETEHQQLAHADTLLQNLTSSLADLSQQEDKNVLMLMHKVNKSLDAIKHVHPQIAGWAAAINVAAIQLDDTSNEIHHYLDNIDLNPERLQWVEQRMQSIHTTARKYKITPTEIPELMQKITDELGLLETNEHELTELHQKQKEIAQEYMLVANQLSQKRIKSGKKLAKEITQTIRTLSLPNAEFQIDFQMEEENAYTTHGLEKITFMVKTNRGSAFYPLAKIASGGELSRISLAIHLATAEQYTVPTLIFDEVDVGIGGGTAELVGKLLRRLGKTHQVLCITHLPQVAACGNHHVSVEKVDQPDQTYTHIRALTLKDKVKEIARMLGGINITPTTLKHAEEMLQGAAA